MRNMVIVLIFVLGFAWLVYDEVQNTENMDNNIVQEQKLVSIKTYSDWVNSNYPINCDWWNLDRVVDGDTVIVEKMGKSERVRMIGIDTPESKKEGTPVQNYALESTRVLKGLTVEGDEVCLITDQIGDEYDVYDRRLSYVFTAEGLDLNAEMIKLGMARAYLSFPLERKEEFRALELEAKQSGVGRWE